MDNNTPITPLQRAWKLSRHILVFSLASAGFASLLNLAGCDVATRDPHEDDFSASGLSAYNYTSEGIQEFFVDGQWGSNVGVESGGGVVCCVSLPKQWRPGLSVTLEWRRSDCGVPRSPQCTIANAPNWPEKTFKKTVPIEPYEAPRTVQVMFLPDDEIRIYVTGMTPLHPDHPSGLGEPRPLTLDELQRIRTK